MFLNISVDKAKILSELLLVLFLNDLNSHVTTAPEIRTT